MNRLKLKCYCASTGLHVVLLIVLIAGPGFLASRTKDDYKPDMPVLTFVPMITTDKELPGGGNPKAATPPPAPEPVQPKPPEPAPPEPVKPEPKPEPVKPAPEPVKVKPPEPTPAPEIKPDLKRPPSEEPDITNVKPTRTLPRVNLQLTERKTNSDDGKAERARAEARQRQQEERAARERSTQYASALSGLRNNLSGRTDLGEFHGPGGGGLPYANFKQTVMTVYFNAWDPPAGLADEKAVTKASVTIARDGHVISFRITVPSGNAAVDASVRRALDRVKFVAPLPVDSKESERTVPLLFDLTAKRDLG